MKKSFILILVAVLVVGYGSKTLFAEDPDDASYVAVVAGTTITNTGSTVITGDFVLSPGTSVTGFPPGIVVGTPHINNAAAAAVKVALSSAFSDLGGITPVTTIPTELGGTTLTTGVYDSGSGTFEITGTLTLDGEGNPDAFFVLKTSSTLVTAENSSVVLINDAQACNVYWHVGSSATVGTDSDFKGSILASQSATITNGANIDGRVAVINGAVTLDDNTITNPCSLPPRSPATLHVINLVVNANSGTAVPSDFDVYVKDALDVDVSGSPADGTSAPGTSYSLAAGTYTVSEDTDSLYVQSFSGACDSDGSITLDADDEETCTIINTDIPPPESSSGGGSSGTRRKSVPPVDVPKVPTPVSLPEGAEADILVPVPGFPDTGSLQPESHVFVDWNLLNVRESASLESPIRGEVPIRTQGTLMGSLVQGDGYDWVLVRYQGGLTGWSVTAGLVSGDMFAIGEGVITVRDMNVRSVAGLREDILDVENAGSRGLLMTGPIQKDGYRWWQIQYENITGWTAETGLRLFKP